MNTEQDLVFLVDSSQVVTKDTFASFLYFIKAVTASLNVSKEETHVGVVKYGTTPRLEITLDEFINQSSLDAAIERIKFQKSPESYMGKALSLISSDLYNSTAARTNAVRVLVILTASISQDDAALPAYKLAKYNNVTIFAIGVGEKYNLSQLKEIASDTDGDQVVTLSSGKELSLQSAVFKQTIARGTKK